METVVKLLKTFFIIAIVMILAFFLFKYAKNFVMDFDFSNIINEKSENPTDRFRVKTQSSGNNHYAKFKDVIGTAASENGQTVYYNLDLTLKANSAEALDKISGQQRYTVEIMRTTLGKFRREDVSNEDGRNFLKQQLQMELNRHYGKNSVDEVYIEKFLYQAR